MAVTVIVPYRRRREHLVQFVPHIERFLGGECHIVVIEQADDKLFNKGRLLNVGVSLSRHLSPWVVLHDVDMLPADSTCEYSEPDTVSHLAGAPEQYGYKLPYLNYFGGVLTTTVATYEAVNGYSNCYWGWGNEDDDFLVRVWAHGIPFKRCVGRYRSLGHERSVGALSNVRRLWDTLQSVVEDPSNAERIEPVVFRRTPLERYRRRPGAAGAFESDGLSNLKYRLVGKSELRDAFSFGTPIRHVHELISVAL